MGMSTFEVTIASAESSPLRLLVEADNWVAAWREALRVGGTADLPADARCSVGDDGLVDIDVPSLGRRYALRPTVAAAPREGRPVLVAGETLVDVQATRHPKLFRKGGHGRVIDDDGQTTSPTRRAARIDDDGRDTDRTVGGPAAPEPAEARGRRDDPIARVKRDDPIARVLSDLERQRLMARPLRISSQTGLPTVEPRRRREPTPLTVPRPTTDEQRRPSPVASESLPQQFRPVQAGAAGDRTVDETLQWAVDTAWQHVPCEVALVLDRDDDDFAEVIAARGLREREARGCMVACTGGPLSLGPAPSLIRFPSARTLTFSALDGTSWELAVSSALVVPVEAVDGELTGLGIALVNAERGAGFTDSELRAVAYLARMFAQALG